MRGNLKSILYFIGGACILALIVSLFLSLLPYILLVGVIAYLLIKIVSFIQKKKKEKEHINIHENDQNITYQTDEDDFNGRVIDVEYEEVDKK